MFDAHSPEAQAISNLFVQTLVVCALIGALSRPWSPIAS